MAFVYKAAMAAKFKFLFFYFLSWVIFFDLMRALFLVYHHHKTATLSFSTILQTFLYGLRMDISVAAYILAPVCLFVLLSLFLHFFRRLLIYKIYTLVVLLIVSIITLADLEIYTAWGFRIDATPLRFLSSPREAFASVSHLPLLLIMVLFLICYGLFYFCFRYLLRRIFFQQQNRYYLVTGLLLLLFMGSLIIPIRGGLQQAPLNQSSVYFSTNNFANHAAINATWNFLHSLFGKNVDGKNPYQYMESARAKEIVDSLYRGGGDTAPLIRFNDSTNVIILIWESFTEKALSLRIDSLEVTPRFNELKQEGIFFQQVYASGDRTNKGIPAILSGYPAMPNTTIIHSPGKSGRLKVLSQLFQERNYRIPFFYGGEPEFANIKSYLLHAGYDPIIGRKDFSSADMNSKWGAHDGVVMKRVINDLDKTKRPFFATWLTLSSHEPFEVPVSSAIKGSDNTSLFLNSLHYTDQVVYDFIRQCQQRPWWSNTVVIIIGDHGHPLPVADNKAADFRTPMLWLGGAVIQPGQQIARITSQLDIAATLIGQAGWKNDGFPFSKNIMDSAIQPWAFFTFNNGFGFIDNNGQLVFDNVGKIPIRQEGTSGENKILTGKALQQQTFADYLNK